MSSFKSDETISAKIERRIIDTQFNMINWLLIMAIEEMTEPHIKTNKMHSRSISIVQSLDIAVSLMKEYIDEYNNSINHIAI